MAQKTMSQHVKIATDEDLELGDQPYIYAPYPDYIMQVHEADTRGREEIVELINEHWPAPIEELVKISQEEGEGYSGSLIRSVLRNNYVPQDILETTELDSDEPLGQEEPIPRGRMASTPEDEAWHKVFRLGIRIAMENTIEEEEAFEAFGSGFVEGQKLKEEMGL